MANPKNLTETENTAENPEIPEVSEKDETDVETEPGDPQVEEDQESHCSKHGCRYFLLTVALIYFGIIGMAWFFMYLGRFSILRGFEHVTKTFNSTFSNLENLITRRDSA